MVFISFYSWNFEFICYLKEWKSNCLNLLSVSFHKQISRPLKSLKQIRSKYESVLAD